MLGMTLLIHQTIAAQIRAKRLALGHRAGDSGTAVQENRTKQMASRATL